MGTEIRHDGIGVGSTEHMMQVESANIREHLAAGGPPGPGVAPPYYSIDNPTFQCDEDDTNDPPQLPFNQGGYTLHAPLSGPPSGLTTPRGAAGMGLRDGGKAREERPGTVVSFVIDHQNSELTGEEGDGMENSSYTWTVLGSVLYATILVLLGAALPVAEALRDEWLRSHYVAIFLSYLYLGSSIIYVLLQVEIYLSEKKVKASKNIEKDPEQCHSRDREGSIENPTPLPKDTLLLRLKKHSNVSPNVSFTNTTMESSLDVSRASLAVDEKEQPARRLYVKNRSNNTPASSMLNIPMDDLPTSGRASRISEPPSPTDTSGYGLDTETLKQAVLSLNQNNARERRRRIRSCSEGSDDPSLTSMIDQCSEDNDAIYEQVVLLNQTATLAHEGAGFYLRVGCLLFGIGNFIFVVLELEDFLSTDDLTCIHPLIYPKWFQLVFLLFQTFFLFKNSKMQHVRRFKGLIRFGALHILATNLDTWLRVLVEEVSHAFHKEFETHGLDVEALANDNSSCSETSLLKSASPYLYPFILEYSLIAVANMAGMYHALNLHIPTDMIHTLKKLIKKSHTSTTQDSAEHKEDTFFAKSHRGMYAGTILLTATIISIIFFFFQKADEHGQQTAIYIFYTSDITLQLVLLVAVIVAMWKLRGFKFTFSRDNHIDDNLLMLSMSGLILLSVFTFVAAFSALTGGLEDYEFQDTNAALAISASVLGPLQALVQAAFVLDSLQRCPRNAEQQHTKPGRGAITFLIIGNLSLWVFKTFQVKEVGVSLMEEYYGSIAWVLIQNVNLPLLLFYRFHSSVCLSDIWISAYEPEHGPQYKML